MSERVARQYDGQAMSRPASDDSVPLREHLEKLIDDLRRHFEASVAGQAKRFDDLRAADKTALDAAFASSDRAIQTAFASSAAAVHTALEANEKRLDGLNELRDGVAMTIEVKALELQILRNEKAIDKLEAKFEATASVAVGRAGGLKDYVGWIVAAVTVASTIIGWVMLARR